MSMDELVNELVSLQEERKAREAKADEVVAELGYDRKIRKLKEEMYKFKKLRSDVRFPYDWAMVGIDIKIKSVCADIIKEWGGGNKTLPCHAGTLRFTTAVELVDNYNKEA